MGHAGKVSLEYLKGDRIINPNKKRSKPMDWSGYEEEEEDDD